MDKPEEVWLGSPMSSKKWFSCKIEPYEIGGVRQSYIRKDIYDAALVILDERGELLALALEECGKLREALAFYADEKTYEWYEYESHYNDANGNSRATIKEGCPIDIDNGQRAREALGDEWNNTN